MSFALPPIATGERTFWIDSFLPLANITRRLFDHLVGARKQRRRQLDPERRCGLVPPLAGKYRNE
jgi:hypothetical protein